jgi:hypothetical protein
MKTNHETTGVAASASKADRGFAKREDVPRFSPAEGATETRPEAVAEAAAAFALAPEVGDSAEPASPRTSEVLRGILTKNPGVKTFNLQRILSSIGSHRLEAALMMFSVPAIVPVPTERGTVSLSTGALACHLVAGRRTIKLPGFIRKKVVSRRALAVAIHAALPLLEAAEKVARPRWGWVSHPYARRAIGLLVFVLAIAIAEPLLGFNALHATAVFVMSFGLAEQDGLAVVIGFAVGISSLIMLAASGFSARAVRTKGAKWLRRIARRLGLRAVAALLERRGYDRLAALLSLRWSDLIMMLWDPEKSGAPGQSTRRGSKGAGAARPTDGTQPRIALRSDPTYAAYAA